MRVVEAADHFVSCLRWAPSVFKDDGGGGGGSNGVTNGTKEEGTKEQIRCLLACGSVDLNVRVFSA